MHGLKRGSVAIVGVAESDLGLCAPGTQVVDLMAQATMRALEDSGLKLSDIDGIFTATTQMRMSSLALKEYLGINQSIRTTHRLVGRLLCLMLDTLCLLLSMAYARLL